MNRAQLLRILSHDLGRMDPQFRGDANETLLMAKSLEHYYAKNYEVKYPPSKGRLIVPINTTVNTGANSHTYKQTDEMGEAKILDSYADDVPMVGVKGAEFSEKIVPIADGYFISIQDLRAAAFSGQDIDGRKALAARKVMERKLDKLIALGDAGVAMKGFANHASVPLETAAGTLNGGWDAATNADIIEDLEFMSKQVYDRTLGTRGDPDQGEGVTIALPTTKFSLLAARKINDYSDTTLLEWAKAKLLFVKEITSWGRLNTADAALTGPRAVVYVKDPDVVECVIPQDFEQMAPQAKGLGWQINCHMRWGGVVWREPKAATYYDGL
jgi:hypothetical protein